MKICMISFHSCPYSLLGGEGTGGMSVYLRELSAALTQIPGIKVDIFTRIQRPDLRGVKDISQDLRLVHLKGGPESIFDRRHLYDFLPEFTNNLVRFIQEEDTRCDLIYTHYWLSGVIGVWLKHKLDLPFVHMYHTLSTLKNKSLDDEEEHPKRSIVEEGLCFVSDAIVSSTWDERQSLIKTYGTSPSKVRMIYPGINKQLFHPCPSLNVTDELRGGGHEKLLLFVGRIEPVKGLMTVIHALSSLKRSHRDLYEQLKLVVVGGGQEKDLRQNKEYRRIIKSAAEEKVDDRVVFLGSKNQQELKHYYTAADVLLVPSLYESFGLVIIEALACGTPVIASQIGDMSMIVKKGQNGFLFQPDDPFSLASSLETFFSHQTRLLNRNRISRDATKNFSWENTARETYQLFSRLTKRKKLPTTIVPLDGSLLPI